MKINPMALNRIYKAGSSNASMDSTSSLSVSEARGAAKVDTISISSAGSSQREIGKLSKSVMNEIAQMDNPGRIEAISKAVEEGTYQISASAVADSILQRIFIE
ncbi:flagellar biosynthesis anti-sigma factor FlgM [Marasmitruncus massiliensis]|jgi:anti-sigma28 factor (negative regulator of flagellin synthesis)|uniref:flagellar biosynthesis anti-sigma factor FlgM n=1 Tax=Marasmitruncus massiliensis TaxID=1944642 RepID=UPI000C79EC69|nr:flagellar biosynthesis anti-sigma factor FlgM [Marasmitruncus massiliensis]MBE6906509.1 flagellar biosynthesis anti-sigma factor FlgM [Oscillospiraceae bacterium]